MKKLFLFPFLFLFLFSATAYGLILETDLEPGETKLAGRPIALGGTFVGLADDGNAVFYNPAGLSKAKGIVLTFKDSRNVSAGQSYPTPYGTFGLGITMTSLTNPSINFSSTVINLAYGGDLWLIPPLSKLISFGLGFRIIPALNLAVGAGPGNQASGYDLDFGLMYRPLDWFSIGASGQNLGSGALNWENGSQEAIPTKALFGAGIKLIGEKGYLENEEQSLNLGLDLELSERARPSLIHLGVEGRPLKPIVLRAGLNQSFEESTVKSNFTGGVGLTLGEWEASLSYQPSAYYFSLAYAPIEWIVPKETIPPIKLILKDPVVVSTPVDDYITYDSSLFVEGEVKEGVKILINGMTAYIKDDNTFKTEVLLNPGKNLIEIAGLYDNQQMVITRKVLRKTAFVDVTKDIPGKEQIEELATLGVVEPKEKQQFRPEARITRAEFAVWLAKARDIPLPKVSEDISKDVSKDHLAAPYIKAILDLGLMTLYPDGNFGAEDGVTEKEGIEIIKKFDALR